MGAALASIESQDAGGLPELEVEDRPGPRFWVLDNYGTHKTAMIHNWLARRPQVLSALHPDQRLMDQPRSSAGLPPLRNSRFAAALIAARKRSKRRSDNTLRSIMRAPSHLSGPKPPIRFCKHSKDTVQSFLIQDTRILYQQPSVTWTRSRLGVCAAGQSRERETIVEGCCKEWLGAADRVSHLWAPGPP